MRRDRSGMRFVPTELAGRLPASSSSGARTSAASSPEPGAATSSAMHGLVADIAQCSISRNAAGGDAARPALPDARRTRRRSSSAARAGAIFDVIVDLRADSPTHAAWFGVELDAEQGTALYVPKGFAHGFQTLVDERRGAVHDLRSRTSPRRRRACAGTTRLSASSGRTPTRERSATATCPGRTTHRSADGAAAARRDRRAGSRRCLQAARRRRRARAGTGR